MRSPLGRLVALTLGAGALVIGAIAPGVGAAPPTSTAPATDPPPIEAAPTTATVPTTTTSTTTTSVPAPLVAEVPVGPSRTPVTPERGTQFQLTPTIPPPFTTTTTTVPPAWALPANSGSGRRVVYSKSRQRVWTVEADGRVSKTHLVSGRKEWNRPLSGTHRVFSRSTHTCALANPAICWRYMVRFAKAPGGDNIGLHEIPTDTRTGRKMQSVSQLGQPLSGGCVRQSTPDAVYMWGWAPIGTKVVVLP